MTTTHYADAEGNYIGGFGDGAQPPEGAIERPAPPNAWAVWQGGAWAEASPLLADERDNMSVTRGQFLIAAIAAGIITEETAEEAAGGSWPVAFDTFLSGLTAQQRIAAKSAWVDGDMVRRNNPILALIAADQGVSETEVDDLFRAAAQVDI